MDSQNYPNDYFEHKRTTHGAFYGSEILKHHLLKSLIDDRRNDRFIQGAYLQGKDSDYRGCHLGCSVRSMCPDLFETNSWDGSDPQLDWHFQFSVIFGFPEDLVYLQEHIFESLPFDMARLWSESVIDAVLVGADLSKIAGQVLDYLIISKAFKNILKEPVRELLRTSSEAHGTPVTPYNAIDAAHALIKALVKAPLVAGADDVERVELAAPLIREVV